jgi:hypothetical protein
MPDPQPPAATGSPSATGTPAAPPPSAPPVPAPADINTPLSDPPKNPDPPKAPEAPKPGEPAPAPTLDIKFPEGFNADPELAAKFKTLASEAGLKSEGAQKIVEFYASMEKAQTDALAKQLNAWKTELEASPTHQTDMALARKAMVTLAKDLPAAQATDVRQILEHTWVGQNPGILALLVKVGKLIGEDKLEEPGAPPQPPKIDDPAQALFGDFFKSQQ